ISTLSLHAALPILAPVEMTSLLLALAGGWTEAEAFAYPLPEPFPLLRGHVLTALSHAPAEIGATGTVPSMSAEEDTAQDQNSKGLPEGRSEERRVGKDGREGRWGGS